VSLVLIRFPTNTTQFHCQKAFVMRDRPGSFAELLPDNFCSKASMPKATETNKAHARRVAPAALAQARKIEREIRVWKRATIR